MHHKLFIVNIVMVALNIISRAIDMRHLIQQMWHVQNNFFFLLLFQTLGSVVIKHYCLEFFCVYSELYLCLLASLLEQRRLRFEIIRKDGSSEGFEPVM